MIDMFSSLESFSIFFFVCLGLIVLGIVFEDKLIKIVERMCRNAKGKQKAKMYGGNSK